MKGRTVTFFLVLLSHCSTFGKTMYRPIPKLPTVMCGNDNRYNEPMREGTMDIDSFPWLGLLMYPVDALTPVKTTVVLISRQLVLAVALDIDKYPKHDFRARSRVVLGQNRTNGPFLRVRDYTYHPDFMSTTYSTVALVQLDTKPLLGTVLPICPPPNDFEVGESIFALTVNHDLDYRSMVNVYVMDYVDDPMCRDYYKRAQLDIETMWPTHMACARAMHGGNCVWSGGTALVIRDGGRWKLLGLGVYGPGCEAPARFLDYGMYHLWVKGVITNIGHPAITKLGPDHIILRRTTSNIQRFGECDPEEAKMTIFSDRTMIGRPPNAEKGGLLQYNVTLHEHVDYHCVVFRVWHRDNVHGSPEIRLRRWCSNKQPNCSQISMKTIFYYVEIRFRHACVYEIVAYGTEVKYIDPKSFMMYTNRKRSGPSFFPTFLHINDG